MDGRQHRGSGRQLRRRAGCGGGGHGGLDRASGGTSQQLGGRVVTRTFLALAASAADDLRDRDGLARPFLRRGALRLASSPRAQIQRMGEQYLRIDPPTPEELTRASGPSSLPAATGTAPDARKTTDVGGGTMAAAPALPAAPGPTGPAHRDASR